MISRRFIISVISAFLFSGILLILSCNSGQHKVDTAKDSPAQDEIPDSSVVFDLSSIDTLSQSSAFASSLTPLGTHVKVVIRSITGYGADEDFARETASLLEQVINSKEFKQQVEATDFSYHTNGNSAESIYQLIMKAHEIHGAGGIDSVIDLRLRTITLADDGQRWMNACNRSTIGIDGGGSGVAAVCANWLRSAAQGKHYNWLAAHFIHEYMHILDFRHPDHKAVSVPYLIQNIVENL